MNAMKTQMPADVPAKALIVIERSHPSQTEAGLAVLNHLANHPEGCRFDALYDVFCKAKSGQDILTDMRQNLNSILQHLVKRQQVEADTCRRYDRIYYLGDMCNLPSKAKAIAAYKAARAAAKTGAAAQSGCTAYVGVRVPPHQYDVLHGPVYVPSPSAAPRVGSLDFKRIASHGYGC